MKKSFLTWVFCAAMSIPAFSVSAGVLNYQETMEAYKQEEKTPQVFEIEDGAGKKVSAVAKEEILYATAKENIIRSAPGEKGKELTEVQLGTQLLRIAVCDNGWSKVTAEEDGKKVSGYISDQSLSDTKQIEELSDTVKVQADSDILDFPGRKDGEVVGEVLELDEVERTGTVNEVWSRILYEDEAGAQQVGYIPTASLEGQEVQVANADTIDKKKNAGIIHESEGEGVFAEAVDGVSDLEGKVSEENGVQIGNPIAVSSDAALKSLGTFRITHYCQCSICCGPWANGITSTGVTATTNHTIAVNPSQIPYGSQVVINGQVYVAEDCGGAIKDNCIDIYVASHAEGETKGVFYTEVYLVQ